MTSEKLTPRPSCLLSEDTKSVLHIVLIIVKKTCKVASAQVKEVIPPSQCH